MCDTMCWVVCTTTQAVGVTLLICGFSAAILDKCYQGWILYWTVESVHVRVFGFDLCVCVFWCMALLLYPGVYPGIRSWSANPGSWRVSADVDCQALCLVH